MNRREFLYAGAIGLSAVNRAAVAEPVSKRSNLGLLLYSYSIRSRVEKKRGFSEPLKFLEFAHNQGAAAVQLPLGNRTSDEAVAIRRACDRLQMRIEGLVSPPKDSMADQDRFSVELATARSCGASVVRMVMLGGRRYEVFSRAEDYSEFARGAEETLKRADRIAAGRKVVLAVENHKDFRIDEMIDVLKRVSSEWIGVCLDTGNNLALLDDPMAVIQALAPLTRTVHLKDIGVEESQDGFRMSEVPLGQGSFDLQRMISTIQLASPRTLFQLEMITRDPLSIPCLNDRYWITMQRVPGTDLAQTLAWVRKSAKKEALLKVTPLSVEQQVAIEDRNVRESFDYASKLNW